MALDRTLHRRVGCAVSHSDRNPLPHCSRVQRVLHLAAELLALPLEIVRLENRRRLVLIGATLKNPSPNLTPLRTSFHSVTGLEPRFLGRYHCLLGNGCNPWTGAVAVLFCRGDTALDHSCHVLMVFLTWCQAYKRLDLPE